MDQLTSYIAQPTLTEWLIYGGLLFFFLVQLLFYLVIYRRPYRYEKHRAEILVADDQLPGISVIITSKNEAEELKKNLPYILEQDYPNYEVIVVNNGSTDETDTVLKAAQQVYPHLYHTYVPPGADTVNEKKLALTLGVKAANHDILLFTEAYCKPCSTRWIHEYGKEFTKGRELVLGYSRLSLSPDVPMRRFIRFDNLIHHLGFLSMAIDGKAYTAIGRNMAYKKALFFEQKGFSPILHIDGGEFDLFINRVAQGKNTGVVLSRASMTETNVVDRFSTWRSLKSVYVYTKQFYRGSTARLFGWETLSMYAFYLLFLAVGIVSLVTGNLIALITCCLLFLCLSAIQLIVINKNSQLLDGKRYHLNLLLFDLSRPISNGLLRIYANRRNKR
ncbi:MAG: glycosyltransferase [Bacteroidota bacterium]|jgi:glycosyltransferase involved in cell wall biosynthesis|nr:glycosyltransferase [Bacteroidota bacterium]HHU96882.1 glycosyltransferase [Petrimonas sp.]